MVTLFIRCFFSLVFLLCATFSFAATVTTVKGKKVLIETDGDSLKEGDEFFLINPSNNKKSAIIKIKIVKNEKAVAEVLKGKAEEGFSLLAKGEGTKSFSIKSTSEEAEEGVIKYDGSGTLRDLKSSWGVLGAFFSNSMAADISSSTFPTASTSNMAGSGFGLGGYYDPVFTSAFVGHIYGGFEQFNVSGSNKNPVCANTTNCNANITYLSGYALLKWYMTTSKYRNWIGAGTGYLFALSKSSTALNESQISTNQVYTFAYGLDLQMSRRNYLPITLEYNLFPSSATVKANQIIIKAGWAWNL